ncbi:flavoprotein [Micromonospora sp. NPDC023888]|uniref:flavoprotein n=1 Tax=Micromonospora sp. NPDC023888 TaxID=3155607 RepID=UPI0033D215A5
MMPPLPQPPPFRAARVVFLGTGALSVAHLPFWLTWMANAYPDVEVRLLLTPSADRFVSRVALSPIVGAPVELDVWPAEPTVGARHAELNEWAQTFIVFPATLSFVGRFAVGLADSPTLLAMQCTTAPVVLAPSLPPGGFESVAYRRHLADLAERRNVAVVPPVVGRSSTTGRMDAHAAAALPLVFAAAQRLREELE